MLHCSELWINGNLLVISASLHKHLPCFKMLSSCFIVRSLQPGKCLLAKCLRGRRPVMHVETHCITSDGALQWYWGRGPIVLTCPWQCRGNRKTDGGRKECEGMQRHSNSSSFLFGPSCLDPFNLSGSLSLRLVGAVLFKGNSWPQAQTHT